MDRPLDIAADLDLSVDGENVTVQGEGDYLVVNLPSLTAGRRLLESASWGAEGPYRRLSRVSTRLRASGFTVEVRLQGDVVARLGARAQPGALARLLNGTNVEVQPGSPIRHAVREQPFWTVSIVAALSALIGFVFFWRSRE